MLIIEFFFKIYMLMRQFHSNQSCATIDTKPIIYTELPFKNSVSINPFPQSDIHVSTVFSSTMIVQLLPSYSCMYTYVCTYVHTYCTYSVRATCMNLELACKSAEY